MKMCVVGEGWEGVSGEKTFMINKKDRHLITKM